VVAEFGAAVLAGAPAPEKVLEDWVGEHPEDSNSVALLAAVYERNGDVNRAVSLYERSLQAAPGNAVTLNNLAVLYQKKGDPRALETAKQAHDAAPESAAIQDTYGWILYENGRLDDAVKLLAEAAKGLPGNSEVLYHYAAALANKGDLGSARAVMKKVDVEKLPESQRGDASKLRDSLGD
jgi:Flp pilus assembly protein TadD